MSGTAAAVLLDRGSTSIVDTGQPRLPDDVVSSIRKSRSLPEIEQTAQSAMAISESMVLPTSPVTRPRVANFTALQEWDGFVVSINGGSFNARLTDLTAGGMADAEEVEIPFEELDEASARRVEPGSLFRWSIGYERSPAGQKTRVSRIIVRQLPRWSKTELQRANREAAELIDSIKWQE